LAKKLVGFVKYLIKDEWNEKFASKDLDLDSTCGGVSIADTCPYAPTAKA
jgi:hypothetical protein